MSNLKADETQAKDQAGQEEDNAPLQAPAMPTMTEEAGVPPTSPETGAQAVAPQRPAASSRSAAHQGQAGPETGSLCP